MRVEEINVFIDSPTQKRNVDKLEKAYISAIFDNLGRKRHESSSLSDAITWICSDFGVPLSNAWFFKEYNILVFASDESFGGLMETLFSIAH